MFEDEAQPAARKGSSLSWWVTTVVIQVVIVFLTFVMPVEGQIAFSWFPVEPWPAALLLLVMLSVLVRTRVPWLFFAATATPIFIFAFEVRPPYSLIGLILALVFSTYAVCTRLSLRSSVILAAGVLTLFVTIVMASRGVSLLHIFPVTIFAALVIGVSAGQMTSSRRRLMSTTEQLLEATRRRADDAERTREALAATRVAEQRLATARDLHDTVGHKITLINFEAGAAERAVRDRPEQALQSLSIIEQSAADILDEIGALLRELRRDEVREEPSVSRLQQLPHLAETFSSGGLLVTVDLDPRLPELDQRTDVTAYRIMEEALVNAYKHGRIGEPARAAVSWDGTQLLLEVSNAVDESRSDLRSSRLGLIGIRERAREAGGEAVIRQRDGIHEMRVSIPVKAS